MRQDKQARKAQPSKSCRDKTLRAESDKEEGGQIARQRRRTSRGRHQTDGFTGRASQHEGQQQSQEQDFRASKTRVLQQAAKQGVAVAPYARTSGGKGVINVSAAIADPLTRPPRRLGQAVPHLLQGKASRPVTNLKSLRHSRHQLEEPLRQEHAAAAVSAEHDDEAAESVADQQGGGGNIADMTATKLALHETKHVQQTGCQSAAQQTGLLAALPPDMPLGEERLRQLRRLLQLRFCTVVVIDAEALPEQLHAKVDELMQRLSEGEPATAGQSNKSGVMGLPGTGLSNPQAEVESLLDGFAVSPEFACSPVDEKDLAEGPLASGMTMADTLQEEDDQGLALESSELANAGEEDDAALGSMGELWEESISPGKPISALHQQGCEPAHRSSPGLRAWMASVPRSKLEREESLPDIGSDLSLASSDLAGAGAEHDEGVVAHGSRHASASLRLAKTLQSLDGCQTLLQDQHAQQVGPGAGACRDEPADPVQEFAHWCDNLQA